MKLETYLNALEQANSEIDGLLKYSIWLLETTKRVRQRNAFRDRIIRMDERKDIRIRELEEWVNEHAYLVHIHKSGGPK